MILIIQHLFGNFFSDSKTTTTRLSNFAEDAYNKLVSQNVNNVFDEIIACFEVPKNGLMALISGVDVALGVQKGKTLTTDQLIALFKKTMSEKEGVIADALGGFGSTGYIEFYPHGVNEYSKGTKTVMPTLINRGYTVATTHAAQLSPALLATLQAFKSSWNTNRQGQQEQIGTVNDSRDDRDQLRAELEIGLLKAIHKMADKYPNNINVCTSYFNFNLLYPISRSKKNNPDAPVQ